MDDTACDTKEGLTHIKKATQKEKQKTHRHCLGHDDEDSRHGIPGKHKTQRRPQHPRQRRIKDKPWLAEPVVRPLRPSREEDPLSPLARDVQPLGRVKPKAVPRSNPQPETWRKRP